MNIHSNFLIISKLLCALCSLVYVSPSFGSDILVKINNTDRGKGPLCQHCCRLKSNGYAALFLPRSGLR